MRRFAGKECRADSDGKATLRGAVVGLYLSDGIVLRTGRNCLSGHVE